MAENLHVLREKKADAVKALGALLETAEKENRDLTAEEAKTYDATDADRKILVSRIARLENHDAIVAEEQEVRPAGGRPTRIHANGAPAKKEFENIAEFIGAVVYNPDDQRLASLWNEGIRADQEMKTGTKGGFAIPEQFRSTLLEIPAQGAVVRPRATVIPAGSPPDAAISMPALDQTGDAPDNMYGGVAVQWIAEGATKPETSFALRQIKLEPQEVAGSLDATDKLLRNWTAASSIIERLLRGALTTAQEVAFLSGDGIGKPLGVINSGAAATVNREASNSIFFEDLTAMAAKIIRRGGSPVWIGSPSIIPQLLSMRNRIGSPPVGSGELIWQQNARDGFGNTQLLGFPLLWNDRSPALGSKGDLILADLSYYLIKDGSGPFVASSEHVQFRNNITVIKIFTNVDGQPWLTAPIELADGYTVSPFVILDVPA